MAKTLSDRIAERAKKNLSPGNAKNRAAFLALREDIKQALNDGWPIKSIWETLHDEGKVTFSYQAFRGYVNRLVLTAQSGNEVSEPDKTGESEKAEVKAEKPPVMPSFSFKADPNKEELF